MISVVEITFVDESQNFDLEIEENGHGFAN